MEIENNMIGFVKASAYRQKILTLLTKGSVATPSDIARKLQVNLSQVSRTLSELEELGLIACTTPNRSKGRIYRATEKGIQTIESMGM